MKRIIVHVKQANEILGFISKKGKAASDCFATVTLLGSSQKYNTKTIKKTTDPIWNQWFCFNLQENEENIVRIELFHYMYFGENKSLGYVQTTLDNISIPKDLTLTLEPNNNNNSNNNINETDTELHITGNVECRLLPVLDGEEPLIAFERHTPAAATSSGSSTGVGSASTSTSTASGEGLEEGSGSNSNSNISGGGSSSSSSTTVKTGWDKKKKAKTLTISLPNSNNNNSSSIVGLMNSSSSNNNNSGIMAESPRIFGESGNISSPIKRSTTTFFRRNQTPVKGEAPSISALALSYTYQKSPMQQPLQAQQHQQQQERRTAGGLTKKSLESLSIPRRSKRNAQTLRTRTKAVRVPEKDTFGNGNGNPLVECFFVVTPADLAGDVEERLEEIRHDDPGAPSRLVVDPLVVAYSGAIAEVCPDHGWDTLAPSVWMFCAPEGLFLSRVPRAPEVFPFVMTAENGERRYVTCLKHYVPLPQAEAATLYERCGHDGGTDNHANDEKGAPTVYAPRIYCVSATIPCYTFCREWLCRVHALSMGPGEGFSLEASVAYLLGVPAPAIGGAALRATLDGRALCEVKLPPKEDHPQFLDVPLRLLFRMLSVDNILLIFRSLLVEEKVLLLSCAKTVLTYFEEALTALMWPLRWSCIQISILPHQLSDFMSGPIVYLIGIPQNETCTEPTGLDSFDLNNNNDHRRNGNINLPDDALIVDLDNDTATLPKSKVAAAALPPLPEDRRRELVADLREYTVHDVPGLDECGWQPWGGDAEVSDADFNLGVRAAFLRFLVGLVRGYRESCRYIRVFPTPQMAIDEDLFARSAGKQKHPFYKAFSRSQALVGFLEAHKWPRENLFDAILEASTVGEEWASSAHGIRDHLKSIEMSSPATTGESITAALRTVLPEKEAAEKRKIEEEEEGEGEGEKKSTMKEPIDAGAVRAMKLPPYVVVPDSEKKKRKRNKKDKEKEKEKEKDKSESDMGKPFVPHTNEIEYDDPADSADSLGLYIVIADAIVDDKAGTVNADMTTELLHRLKTRSGRIMFSETLLSVDSEEVRKGHDIQLSVDSCQVLGTLIRHALDMAYSEDDIISPQLLFQVGSTFYDNGNGDLVLLLLKGAKIWNEQRFWETLFYRKAHEECARLYPPSIFVEMTKWSEKSDKEKEEIANTEVQALWKLLCDFSTFFKKFCMKMANMTQLDKEHMNTLSVLIKNMAKLNQLDDPMVSPRVAPVSPGRK